MNNKNFSTFSLIILFFLSILPLNADNGIMFYFIPGERLVIRDRQNIRINEYYNFDKGPDNYLGFSFREVKGILTLNSAGIQEFELSGNYYIFQTLKRNDTLIAKMIEEVVPVSFNIFPNGQYEVSNEYYFPNLQSFPLFPTEPVEPGDIWTGYGVRVVDPDRDGNYTRVRFLCEFTYLGPDVYNGRPVHFITAQYAMRYSRGDDPFGDPSIVQITGKHVVTIRMAGDGLSLELIQDLMDEQYLFADDRVLEFNGSILTFFEGTEPLDKPEMLKELLEELGEKAGINTEDDPLDDEPIFEEFDIELDEHPDGIILTINNIHFVENEAIVLADEEFRLDSIAEVLLNISDRTFFVIGHTTDIGPVYFLYELSVARAKAIVDALIDRGIPAARLLYEGRGGTEPLVPNNTEENKTRNRRVEIIILED